MQSMNIDRASTSSGTSGSGGSMLFKGCEEMSESSSSQVIGTDSTDLYQPSYSKNYTHDLTFILPVDSLMSAGGQEDMDSPSLKSTVSSKLYAHKMKITEKSEYFKLLLTNGMKESSQHEIVIPNIPVNIFFEILKFLYSSELAIHQDNLIQIYLVCDQFLLEEGKQLCRSFIKSVDNESLCRLLFEEEYNICAELTVLYMEHAVLNSSFFLNDHSKVVKLSKELLVRILMNPDIMMKEIDIFKAALEWTRFNNYSLDSAYDTLVEVYQNIRFPLMDYEDISNIVEPSSVVPSFLLLEAYKYLSKPKLLPNKEHEIRTNIRLNHRKKIDPSPVPGCDVYSIQCCDHKKCNSVSWPIENFSTIKSQKHVSSTFQIFGLTWRMWAYPAGEAKHSDSFSVYLEAVRVKEKESYDFLRNTTFFFALVNQKNKTLSRHYPSSPNVLFNYEKSVWGNGLIELKILYDKTLGYLENDTVIVQLHILECIALEG